MELKKQFEELLRAFRDYQDLSIGTRNGHREGTDETDVGRLRRTADLARDTFQASFRARLEETPEALSSMPFEQAVGKMVEWASELLPQKELQESFSTVETCSARLRQLTSEMSGAVSHELPETCWPFIQQLRVYLKAHILSKGLIVADLPGLRDLKSARKAITERYIRKCHQVFVVAKIDRAITDESIKDIMGLASRANLCKVDVVCTRSEEIDENQAMHDWSRDKVALEKIKAMQTEIKAETDETKSLRDELDYYEDDREQLSQGDFQEFMDLSSAWRKAKNSRDAHKFELRRFIVKKRNEGVSSGLQREYKNHPVARLLKTFCVSNRMYWDQREQRATIALPYLELSGILELRRYCIGIVADSHFRAMKAFVKDEIPALLGSIELWVEAGSGNITAERKQQILNVISAIERQLDEVRRSSSL